MNEMISHFLQTIKYFRMSSAAVEICLRMAMCLIFSEKSNFKMSFAATEIRTLRVCSSRSFTFSPATVKIAVMKETRKKSTF